MTKVIKYYTTYEPLIYCTSAIAKEKESIFNEIRFCFNKKLALINCPKPIKIDHQKHNHCRNGLVYYMVRKFNE